MALLGNRAIADAISGGHQGPKTTGPLSTNEQQGHKTRTRREYHANKKAEIGVMLLRAKTHSGLPRPPDAGGETQHGLSGTAAEGSKPADTLSSDFQPP